MENINFFSTNISENVYDELSKVLKSGFISAGKQSEVFESDVYSPHMLVTTSVKPEWRDKIPAVTHVDNSARHQSVTPESNLKFYNIINKFYEKTQVPVLLNTSFNGPREPIVETPFEAMKCFIDRNLDFLVINNFLITKN